MWKDPGLPTPTKNKLQKINDYIPLSQIHSVSVHAIDDKSTFLIIDWLLSIAIDFLLMAIDCRILAKQLPSNVKAKSCNHPAQQYHGIKSEKPAIFSRVSGGAS